MKPALAILIVIAGFSVQAAAEPIPVRLLLESAPSRFVQINHPANDPMIVRVVRSTDGLPVAGVRVRFSNGWVCQEFGCVHPETLGGFRQFDGISGTFRSPSTIAYSDCSGLAYAKNFEGGSASIDYPITIGLNPMQGFETAIGPGEATYATIQIVQRQDAVTLPVKDLPVREFCGAIEPATANCAKRLLTTGFENGYCGMF